MVVEGLEFTERGQSIVFILIQGDKMARGSIIEIRQISQRRQSLYFGNSAQFWLNLQTQYDLRQAQAENKEIYGCITALNSR